jgi:hypothetical protein
MNNYILINRTYAETTPESVEVGDFSDKGFIEEKQKVTFTELVDLMMEHTNPSQSPHDGNTNVWYSTNGFSFGNSIDREESIHYHHDNTPNAAKYWRLARRYADFKLNVRNMLTPV